jgi:hypothetical protein
LLWAGALPPLAAARVYLPAVVNVALASALAYAVWKAADDVSAVVRSVPRTLTAVNWAWRAGVAYRALQVRLSGRLPAMMSSLCTQLLGSADERVGQQPVVRKYVYIIRKG